MVRDLIEELGYVIVGFSDNLCVCSFLKTRSLVVRGGKFQNHHRIKYGTFSIIVHTSHLYHKFWLNSIKIGLEDIGFCPSSEEYITFLLLHI